MLPSIDHDKMMDFLIGLLNTPSPTGDVSRANAFIQKAFAGLPFAMQTTPKGLLVGTWPGSQATHPRALTAHTDTLGGMVSKIKNSGRLQLTQLGGWQWSSVEGESVTIFASNGATYRGAFMPTAASIHAHDPKARNATRTNKNMEVRIDARTNSAKETGDLGICVGDIVAFDPRVELSDSGFIRSRHLDDKASIAALFAALDALASAGQVPQQDTTIHISNYEEVGHGAAAALPDKLYDLIAIDMAVVAPNQQSTEFAVTICAKDSAGPYHLGLRRELEQLAEKAELNYCTDIYPFYGSDAEAYWRAGGDVRIGLIGPGVDASHHYERTHRDALENTARLIMAYLLSKPD